MTKTAEQLAVWLSTCAIDHKKNKEAAAMLRAQAAEIEHLGRQKIGDIDAYTAMRDKRDKLAAQVKVLRHALDWMLKQFTKVPSTLQDSEVRYLAHKALKETEQ